MDRIVRGYREDVNTETNSDFIRPIDPNCGEAQKVLSCRHHNRSDKFSDREPQ